MPCRLVQTHGRGGVCALPVAGLQGGAQSVGCRGAQSVGCRGAQSVGWSDSGVCVLAWWGRPGHACPMLTHALLLTRPCPLMPPTVQGARPACSTPAESSWGRSNNILLESSWNNALPANTPHVPLPAAVQGAGGSKLWHRGAPGAGPAHHPPQPHGRGRARGRSAQDHAHCWRGAGCVARPLTLTPQFWPICT